jgi:3'-5' exoribonuclease
MAALSAGSGPNDGRCRRSLCAALFDREVRTMTEENRNLVDAPEIPRPCKGPWVADLAAGAEFVGFFVARNPRLVDFRDPGRGKYLRMQLYDRTGVIDARLWDSAEELHDQVKGGGPVKVAGAVETFREELQVNVHRLRRALPGELDVADFVRVTGRDPAAMWETVMQAVKGIQDPHLAAVVRRFYHDLEWASQFIEAPAARRIHHAYRSGFLEHVHELLVLARPLLELYPEIDRDLFHTGILLHDIGKLEELDWGWDTGLTLEGHLVGHIVLGARRVARAIDAIDGFPKARAAELLHLVVSHHGRLEWGSPRRPKSIEAVALHHLDNLDAQVNRFRLLTDNARTNGDRWTSYDRTLGRSLYAGNGGALSR